MCTLCKNSEAVAFFYPLRNQSHTHTANLWSKSALQFSSRESVVPHVGNGQITKCKDRRRAREDNHSRNVSEPRSINLIISVMGELWRVVIKARVKCEGTSSCKLNVFSTVTEAVGFVMTHNATRTSLCPIIEAHFMNIKDLFSSSS